MSSQRHHRPRAPHAPAPPVTSARCRTSLRGTALRHVVIGLAGAVGPAVAVLVERLVSSR